MVPEGHLENIWRQTLRVSHCDIPRRYVHSGETHFEDRIGCRGPQHVDLNMRQKRKDFLMVMSSPIPAKDSVEGCYIESSARSRGAVAATNQ